MPAKTEKQRCVRVDNLLTGDATHAETRSGMQWLATLPSEPTNITGYESGIIAICVDGVYWISERGDVIAVEC